MTDIEQRGITRRDILKKSAAAGAVFWSVPVIESITSAASATSGCPAEGALQISGAAVVYTVGSSTTVYWAAFAANGTTCEASPSVPNDDNWATPYYVCGAYVQVTGGEVLYGTTCLNVAVPQVNPNCYFVASNSGINVTAAGIAAGVNVIIYIFHNGTFPSGCTTFGSKGHWAVACGESNPECGTSNSCFGGTATPC